MALADITPKLTIELDQSQTVPRFTFQDTTDYTSESVVVSSLQGNLKIVINGDTASPEYDNLDDWAAPDIDGGDSGQTNEDLTRQRSLGGSQGYIPLPQNSDGSFVVGTYAFTYQVSDDSGTTTVVSTITMDLQYSKVTGSITTTVNLNPKSPSLKITDATDYVVEGITPTNDRTLTLYFPQNSSIAGSTNTSSASLTVTTFASGIQTAKLVNNVTYDFSSKTSVSASATGTTNTPVFTINILDQIVKRDNKIEITDASNLCSVYCCVRTLQLNEMNSKSATERIEARGKLGTVASLMNLIEAAYECNKTEDINTWVNEIREVAGCDDDCGCDDEPTIISAVTTGGVPVNNFYDGTVPALGNTITQTELAGLVYETGSSGQRDFDVFVDGMYAEVSTFNTNTGVITLASAVGGTPVDYTVRRLR